MCLAFEVLPKTSLPRLI